MREFVALMAALMASNAMAIDIMVPALPAMGEALGVADENRRQLVVTAYLIGFGLTQLVWGPLSDRFGRKPILIGTMVLYAVFALLCALASSFALLLTARVLHGAAAAGTRVLVVSIVRDRFEGAAMARVMSLTFIVFMIVPVAAPSLGQAMLAVTDWRAIFLALAIYGGIVLGWSWLRMPETLAAEARRPLSASAIGGGVKETLANRASLGNTVASTLIFGGMFAFINSVQQIVQDVFGRPELIGLVFGCVAFPIAASSWFNSRFVERYGPQRLAHRAMAAFTVTATLHLILALSVGESLLLFVVMQGLTMASFGMVGANLGSLAMTPLGHIAGTASSVQGMIGTIGGALIGAAIGQAFDGTVIPFLVGLTLCGAAGLAVALWTNGRTERAASADDPIVSG